MYKKLLSLIFLSSLLAACSSSGDGSSDVTGGQDLPDNTVPGDNVPGNNLPDNNLPDDSIPDGCNVVVDLRNGPAQCSSFATADPVAVPAEVLSQVCSAGGTPAAPTLIVIGDSFSQGVSDELRTRLGESVNFCTLSSFGARTDDWTLDVDLLDLGFGVRSIAMAILQRSQDAQVVVSIGAPDVGNDHLALGNDVYRKVHCDLQSIFADFRSASPNVEILISGYDIPNINPGFESQRFSVSCPVATAQQMNVTLIADPQSGEQIIEFPRCVNSVLYGLDMVFKELAVDTTDVRYESAYGTLQNLSPGNPDLDRFADPQYYRDCVHMNPAGQSRYVDALEGLGLF